MNYAPVADARRTVPRARSRLMAFDRAATPSTLRPGTATRVRRPRPSLGAQVATAAMVAADVFRSRRWSYGGHGSEHVPDVEEIAAKISSLLARCESLDPTTTVRVSSGRFLVESTGRHASVWLHLGDVER